MVTYDLKRTVKDDLLSWSEWLTLWNAADTVQECTGLLYCVFQASCTHEEKEERILFLLQLADGHGRPSDTNDKRSRGGLTLSVIAFKQLSRGFFAPAHNEREFGLRSHFEGQSEQLTKALFHFFRPYAPYSGTLYVSGLHNGVLAYWSPGLEKALEPIKSYLESFLSHFFWSGRGANYREYRRLVVWIWTATEQLTRRLASGPTKDWSRNLDLATLSQIQDFVFDRAQSLDKGFASGMDAANVLVLAKAAGVALPRRKKKAA